LDLALKRRSDFMAMALKTERYYWGIAQQNLDAAGLAKSADECSRREYDAGEAALLALVSDPPKRQTLRNRFSDLVSLLPIDAPQEILHDLSTLSYMEGLPSHTTDGGIYYQDDWDRATAHLRAATRVTKWMQEQLEEKIKSYSL